MTKAALITGGALILAGGALLVDRPDEVRMVVETVAQAQALCEETRPVYYVVPEDAPLAVKRVLHGCVGPETGRITPLGTSRAEMNTLLKNL